MFRRHWSGLPKDPCFPNDLKSLGYFINEDDEVRSIEDPDHYFKFFLDRNPRVNARQRFAFDRALEREVHKRLEAQGLEKIRLPLGTAPDRPHVPVFVSADIKAKTHVVVLVGEPSQDLGVLALRVINGPGGIDEGSAVALARALRHSSSADDKFSSSSTSSSTLGLVLANPGQLYWWPEGARGLRVTASAEIPLPSAVHYGRRYVPELNTIPRNETPGAHVAHVFDAVVRGMTDPQAMISVVTIGESCELVSKFLDDDANWAVWGPRLNCMLLLGNVYPDDNLKNIEFKDFLAKRTRAYVASDLPLDTPLSPPEGNPREAIPNLGCPCFASSEIMHTEMILVRDLDPVLVYVRQAAQVPDFENPPIVIVERPEQSIAEEDPWQNIPEDQLPSISTAADVPAQGFGGQDCD